MPLSEVWLLGGPILTKLMNPQQRFVKNNYIELHDNPKDGWSADTRSQT